MRLSVVEKLWRSPDTGERLVIKMVVGTTRLKSWPSIDTDEVDTWILEGEARKRRKLLVEGALQFCHQRTSECVFEPGGRIATQVCKQIRPIARVSLWPVGETERNRDVHVFGFARHL